MSCSQTSWGTLHSRCCGTRKQWTNQLRPLSPIGLPAVDRQVTEAYRLKSYHSGLFLAIQCCSTAGRVPPGVHPWRIGERLSVRRESDINDAHGCEVPSTQNRTVGPAVRLLAAGFRRCRGGGARTIGRRPGIVASMRWVRNFMRREREFYHSGFVRNHDAVGAVTIRHRIPG